MSEPAWTIFALIFTLITVVTFERWQRARLTRALGKKQHNTELDYLLAQLDIPVMNERTREKQLKAIVAKIKKSGRGSQVLKFYVGDRVFRTHGKEFLVWSRGIKDHEIGNGVWGVPSGEEYDILINYLNSERNVAPPGALSRDPSEVE